MKWIRRAGCALLTLCLLFSVSVLGEGILPVLQTPLPEITEAFSLHCMMGTEEPEHRNSDGGETEYRYSNVPYNLYRDFGKGLAQDGYELAGSETEADGTEVVTVQKEGNLPLTIHYLQELHEMTVIYPLRTTARKADPENPFSLTTGKDSILPELKQMISLHSATGVERTVPEQTESGGWVYHYKDVGYSCYSAFSVKLGSEGYSLVSSEILPDGTARAEITDGEVTLTLDYSLETKEASLYYPAGVHARDTAYEEDYTKVREEEPFTLLDGVTATPEGWEWIEKIALQIGATRYGTEGPEEGNRLALVSVRIDYNHPEETVIRDMLNHIVIRYEDAEIPEIAHGKYQENSRMIDSWSSNRNTVKGIDRFVFGIVLELTEEQAKHPDRIKITFTDPDQAVRYVYALEDEDLTVSDRSRARWGIAMTGAMMVNAADLLEEGADEETCKWLNSFLKIDLLAPDKVMILQLKKSQAETAAAALETEEGKTTGIAAALAKKINLQFSDPYTRTAAAAAAEVKDSQLAKLNGRALVVLPYGEHIAVTCMDGDAAGSALIMSTKQISENLSEADILQWTEQLGIPSVKIRTYEGGEMADLIHLWADEGKGNGWNDSSSAAAFLIGKAGSSQAGFTAVLPHMMGIQMTGKMISNYLIGKETVSAEVLRLISRQLYQWKPESLNPLTVMLAVNNNYPSSRAGTAEPVPEWSEILTEEEPDFRGTYQFVVTTHSEGKIQNVYDWPLEAVLPAECIPETPEKAEYIIHVDITYDDSPSVSNGSVSLFYPHGRITVHRASDGALLKECGTVTRKLVGMVMLPRGNNYWDPLRTDTWDRVKSIFEQ